MLKIILCKALSKYKLVAPFVMGKETKEFYANGMGKKNRMQGNEFVHSMKGKHGVTCILYTRTNSLETNSCHSFG